MNGLREQLETLRAEIVAGRYDNAVDWLDIAIRKLGAGMPVEDDSDNFSKKENDNNAIQGL